MNTVLFINEQDILHYSIISGNIDVYKINPIIYSAQILYLESLLGSDLYDKIESLIDSGDITGATYTQYNTLLVNYITPSVVYHTLELFVPLNAFQIADGGVEQHQSTNANPQGLSDIDRIVSKYKIIGEKFDDKLSKYLCKNSNLFPEYINNTGLVNKTANSPRVGWNLGHTNVNHIRI